MITLNYSWYWHFDYQAPVEDIYGCNKAHYYLEFQEGAFIASTCKYKYEYQLLACTKIRWMG